MILSLLWRLLRARFAGQSGTPQPTPAPTPKPAPKPAPKSSPVNAPQAWMQWAMREATDGIEEEPAKDNRGPVIQRYIDLAKTGAQGDPYCAIFVNAALEQAGVRGTRSAMARSFETSQHFVKLDGPCPGCVATFWRGSRKSGKGHTGFYDSENDDHVFILGANQDDDCNVSGFPRNGKTFGLVGYYYPASLPKPAVKRVSRNARVITETKAT
jgi:uncharacterized protein (TIGR02594 family)